MPGFFVTGTDTDAGKTFITLSIMQKLQQQGYAVNAMKPVAAGVTAYPQGDMNEDAVLLQQQSSVKFDYQTVNPYLFRLPIAPHIAAQQENRVIDVEHIKQLYSQLHKKAEFTLVEGAGGWLVPLNANYDVADVALTLELPVILVVGLKLGCINHARLSLLAIQQSGCKISGWVGTQIDPSMSHVEENITALKYYLTAPCLGIVPSLDQATTANALQYLSLDQLVNKQ